MYLKADAPNHETKLKIASSELRKLYPEWSRPMRTVKSVVAIMLKPSAWPLHGNPLADAPRSGRPSLAQKVPKAVLQKVLASIRR